ncbi:MAG: DUF58 domain-containing protein [Victivallaceae bacterium]|nr:DUF58 domain-containing protein [Victivallaceae bacterium]
MNPAINGAIKAALGQSAGARLAAPYRNAGIGGRRYGRRTGGAMEFAEYRDYANGDDLRRLDWNVFARSEKLMVKLFSEEVDPRCDLILDESASMGAPPEKAAAAAGLAALLADAAGNAGFSLNVWHAADALEKEPAPFVPPSWRHMDFDSAVGFCAAVDSFPGGFQPRGLRILVSDLLLAEPPESLIGRLADGASRVVLIELSTGFEDNPPLTGEVTLTDAENGERRELTVTAATLGRYRERLGRHRAAWGRAAEESGVLLLRLPADVLCVGWDMRELFAAGVLE